jgi:hypothetical protein
MPSHFGFWQGSRYLAKIFSLLSSKSILNELFSGHVVYFEPHRIIKGSGLTLEFINSKLSFIDNVLRSSANMAGKALASTALKLFHHHYLILLAYPVKEIDSSL